jgi:hypothetical protein
MKHLVAFSVAALTITVSAQTRVGETAKEIATRYGEGKKAQTQRLAGTEAFEYEKNDFYVEVVILDGKSVMEIYAHRKGTTDDVIKELLKANTTSSETAWRFDRKENRWERGGTPKLVAHRWPGHPDFFCIKDLKACEAAEKKNKPSAAGL